MKLTVSEIKDVKPRILEDLSFSPGFAEDQEFFLESLVDTEQFRKALAPSTLLVIGRKGTGKTAVFRRMLEDHEDRTCAPIAPGALREKSPCTLSPTGFMEAEEMLRSSNAGWAEFWLALVNLACAVQRGDSSWADVLPSAHARDLFRGVLEANREPEKHILAFLKAVFSDSSYRITDLNVLAEFNAQAPSDFFLLFDGLDTGFGNTTDERRRRQEAIQGLFSFVMARAFTFERLRFKVVLREDIWRTLKFENKSHLFGSSVKLEWKQQPDYLKTVLKQALRSRRLEEFVKQLTEADPGNVDTWSERAVFRVWNVLVGERMRGARTAFTRNWVWNRLADGNGDHGPRSLFQLFHEAREWERREMPKSPHDRSIIRPRALIESLETVSHEALSAIEEEFPELEDLLSRLRQIGRTPVEARNIGKSVGTEYLTLAREVGVLQIYEGTEQEVERYQVPELYRLALNMTRKGPA